MSQGRETGKETKQQGVSSSHTLLWCKEVAFYCWGTHGVSYNLCLRVTHTEGKGPGVMYVLTFISHWSCCSQKSWFPTSLTQQLRQKTLRRRNAKSGRETPREHTEVETLRECRQDTNKVCLDINIFKILLLHYYWLQWAFLAVWAFSSCGRWP